ncbi:MAG: hypothetical protein HQL13_03665 [Candidatus Omnitrophica bacterium]|nr:hypothetical protein [Candidatus Omnitrophota bacterium]
MFNKIPSDIVQSNRWPFFMGVIVFIVVLGVFMYKGQMAQKEIKIENRPRQSMDISTKPQPATWFDDEKLKDIRIKPSGSLKVLKETQKEIISQEEIATRLEIQQIEDKQRIEAKKLEVEAMKSPMNIDVPPPPGTQVVSSNKKTSRDDVSSNLNGLMSMVKSLTNTKIPDVSGQTGALLTDPNNQDNKKDFLKKSDGLDDDYLHASKKKARCVYEVKAGSYIPASLMTGINSDLPGSVNAQVTESVYDTVTGNYLLIPQGARLVGEYSSKLTFGQNRVQVVWERIIFPDGQSINLEKMQGVDIAGYTGFHDKVNNHYLRIYGNAVLMSMMGAGYDILNKKALQNTDPRETVAAAVGQKLADVSQQSLQKNMDIQPTIIIDPGYKFKVFVLKDMVLENLKDDQGSLSYTE